MIKTVLFDFDGTIADSFHASVSIFNKLSKYFKYNQLSEDEIDRLRDLPPETIIKYFGFGKLKMLMLVVLFKYELSKVISQLRPYEGIKEVIQSLKRQGYRIGIASSNSKKNIVYFLQMHEISDIDFIYGNTGILGKDKVIRSIMKKYSLQNDELIYIGDEVRDIQASRKAGIQIISVLWGDNTPQILMKYNPGYTAQYPQDIIRLIQTK